jgi:predicted nuclease with TOPRIM domain
VKERIEERLQELRQELAAGETRLRELESEAAGLRETMLRISGAAQVLHELLDADDSSAPPTRVASIPRT